MSEIMVSTTFDIPGYKVAKDLGTVRGIVVRSRNIFASIGASLQTLIGGNITLLTDLCEKARCEAFDIMVANARAINADAITGFRYDSTKAAECVTEVLAYGTAVKIEKL